MMNATQAERLADATERAAAATERLARAERARYLIDRERVLWVEAVNTAQATGGSQRLATEAFDREIASGDVPDTLDELLAAFASSDPQPDLVRREEGDL